MFFALQTLDEDVGACSAFDRIRAVNKMSGSADVDIAAKALCGYLVPCVAFTFHVMREMLLLFGSQAILGNCRPDVPILATVFVGRSENFLS